MSNGIGVVADSTPKLRYMIDWLIDWIFTQTDVKNPARGHKVENLWPQTAPGPAAVVCMVSNRMDQLANPARGQLNREN